jgi:hypothetical protein
MALVVILFCPWLREFMLQMMALSDPKLPRALQPKSNFQDVGKH